MSSAPPDSSLEVVVALWPDRDACVAARRALETHSRSIATMRRVTTRFVDVDRLPEPVRAALPGVGVALVDGSTVLARHRGLISPRAFVEFVERGLRRTARTSSPQDMGDPVAAARAELDAGFPERCLVALHAAAREDPVAIDLRVLAHLDRGDVAAARAANDAGGAATARVTRARVALAERRLKEVLVILATASALSREERLLRACTWLEVDERPRAQTELRDLSLGDDSVAIAAEQVLASTIDPAVGHGHR